MPMTSIDDTHSDAFSRFWHHLKNQANQRYSALTDGLFDEIVVRLSQKEVNDALHEFVTQNVDMLHDLHLELQDDWLRLYATLDVFGVYASVATNLRLVHATLTHDTQRFVFEQIGRTDVLCLYSKNWLHGVLAKAALKLYRLILRQDPLPFALQQIEVKGEPFAVHKGNYIYLDIHRYLAKQKKILGYLAKAQVNDADTIKDNLLLKAQINFTELLNFGEAGEAIISEKDNPALHTNQDTL